MASQKEKLIAEALKLVEKGQHERAVKVYLKVVADGDNDVRVWLKIGDLYTKLRRNHEAAETYQHVAQAYTAQGFFTKAIAVYKQILKLDPSLVAVHENLADLYTQMGLLPDAIDQYSHVAAFYQKENNSQAALAVLQRIVELDPANVATRVKLAEMYSREQMPREAIDEFAYAAEQLYALGRFDDYMKVAERLLFHAPDNRPVSRELARLYLQKGDARRALPRLQVCFKADPRDAETLALLADAFRALGQTVKAASVLKELARIYLENGNLAERDEVFRHILELDPTDPDAIAAVEAMPPRVPSVIIDDQLEVEPASAPPAQAVRPPRMAPQVIIPKADGTTPRDGDSQLTPVSVPAVAATTPTPVSLSPVEEAPEAEAEVDLTAEAAAAPSADDEEVRKILAEADVFMKYSLYAKAIDHLRTVFERVPDHTVAREKLKTVLVAAGRTSEALQELQILASAGGPREAGYLDEVLAIDPGAAWARDRRGLVLVVEAPASTDGADGDRLPDEAEVDFSLDQLGPHSRAPGGKAASVAPRNGSAAHLPASFAPPVASAAVPSLSDDEFAVVVEEGEDPQAVTAEAAPEIEDRFGADLGDAEEIADSEIDSFEVVSQGSAQSAPPPAPAPDDIVEAKVAGPTSAPVDNFDFSSFDDPSVAPRPQAVPRPVAAPAPSRPPVLAAVASLDAAAPVVMLDGADVMEAADEVAARSRPTSTHEVVGSSLEDELEEADFYLAQGMIDEARTVLSTLLESFPDHPLVQAKLRDLPAPEAQEPALEAAAGALRIEALAGLNGAAASAPPPPRSITTSAVAPASRRNVVEHGVGADDFESHFDLGIAYKEMGLLDQAIGEFKTAARDATREVQCQQMMGLCYLAKGMPLEAVRQFKQGLYAEGIREDEELSLYYELGQAYELLNDRAEALYYYERIRKRKARYRDLDRRIESLGRPPETFGAPPAALQRK